MHGMFIICGHIKTWCNSSKTVEFGVPISLRFNHTWKVKPDEPSPVALASHAQCAVGMLQLDWPADQNRPCPKDPQMQIEQPGQLLLGFSDLWNSDLWNRKLKLHSTRIYKDLEGQPIRNSSVLWRLSSSLGAGPQPPATKNWPRMALSTGGPTIHCLAMRIPPLRFPNTGLPPNHTILFSDFRAMGPKLSSSVAESADLRETRFHYYGRSMMIYSLVLRFLKGIY